MGLEPSKTSGEMIWIYFILFCRMGDPDNKSE